jgi:hypothetical protein
MKTDTENAEQDVYSGSSRTRRPQENSDKSPRRLPKNSKPDPVRDDGPTAETKLSSLDVLLTMLQSHLGEIRDFGGSVRLFDDPNGLIIQLPNVAICQNHKMMHSGQICPMC